MHLVIDASRTTIPRMTGTEYYARELTKHLIELNRESAKPHQITLYFRDQPADDLFPKSGMVNQKVIPFPRLWTHLRFAAQLWRERPDVTFVPAHTLPLVFPGRAVVTVHDLGYKYFPDAHPPLQRTYLDVTTRYSARGAKIILADSEATAADLIHFYGTPKDKIHVVYPGITAPAISDPELARRKYGLPEQYFLFIGTLQPRKNIANLVQAFARWRSAHPDDDTGLVLAGGKGWLFDPQWVAGVPNVYLPGFVDDADKGALYAGATALVFPSLYEGFGFPVLEAMSCSTPVIASNTSSLPELVGDGGLQVDPLDVELIAAAMGRVSTDEGLRQHLRELGYRQAAQFTWERAAKQTLAALETAAHPQP